MAISDKKYDLILENIALGNGIPSYILSQESFSDMNRLLKEDGILFAHIGSFELEGNNRFNEALYATTASQFKHALVLSSQPDFISHMVLYLSNAPIDANFNNREAQVFELAYNPELIATDNKNVLDYYFLPSAMYLREATIGLGSDLFYAN